VSKWGLPNGYVLGEEAGGAFFGGLRYGEGVLYTKNAGDLKVFIGGFGMTALTASDIVLVPIRSGVGLRLGANVSQRRLFEIHAAVDLEPVLTAAVRRGSLMGAGPNRSWLAKASLEATNFAALWQNGRGIALDMIA
jgi:small basic protein